MQSPGGETSSFTLLHLFLLHRYLLMLGDLLPSLDRCAAVLFPLRYAVGATCSGACALVAAAALLAAALTAAANMAGVVPGHLTQIGEEKKNPCFFSPAGPRTVGVVLVLVVGGYQFVRARTTVVDFYYNFGFINSLEDGIQKLNFFLCFISAL